MLKLRQLVVVTGGLHAEGGATYERRDVSTDEGDRDAVQVTQRCVKTKDRRRADVIVAACSRKLAKLRLLYTPFGHLVLPSQVLVLKQFLYDATKSVAEFNSTAAQKPPCRISNEYVWEPLMGNRKSALEGWLMRQFAEHDKDVVRAFPELAENAPPAEAVP